MKKVNNKEKSDVYLPVIEGEESFYKSINNALKTTKHKYALENIISEYEKYKDVIMKKIIPTSIFSDEIYCFKTTYQRKNKVWREFEVFTDQSLKIFAESIIDSMLWNNDHLHAFFFPEIRGKTVFSHWYTPFEIGSSDVENDQFPILHTDEVLIGNIDYTKNPKLGFSFDFGDDHRFLVEFISKRKSTKKDDKDIFPKLIDQRGVSPEQYPDYED